MSYSAPLTETHFWLKNVLDHQRIFGVPEYSQFNDEDLDQVLKEIAKIAEEEAKFWLKGVGWVFLEMLRTAV